MCWVITYHLLDDTPIKILAVDPMQSSKTDLGSDAL